MVFMHLQTKKQSVGVLEKKYLIDRDRQAELEVERGKETETREGGRKRGEEI